VEHAIEEGYDNPATIIKILLEIQLAETLKKRCNQSVFTLLPGLKTMYWAEWEF